MTNANYTELREKNPGAAAALDEVLETLERIEVATGSLGKDTFLLPYGSAPPRTEQTRWGASLQCDWVKA